MMIFNNQRHESEYYYALFSGMVAHKGIVADGARLFGEGSEKARQYIAEAVHYTELKRLPAWGVLIERVVIDDNEGVKFICRDEAGV